MNEKTIEDVLNNAKKQIQSLMMDTPYELSEETKIINQATQEIKELIKAKLPSVEEIEKVLLLEGTWYTEQLFYESEDTPEQLAIVIHKRIMEGVK